MKVNSEKFIQDFNLRSFGAKGWLRSKILDCPFCQRGGDKFGIYFNDKGGGAFNCMKCGEKGTIFKLLRKLNRQDLIIGDTSDFTFKDKLDIYLKDFKLEEVDITCLEIKQPLGFKYISYDTYLESRGFEDWQYGQYQVGTSISPKLKNKVVFLLKEDGKIVGYLGRSKHTKEWHNQNLKKFKLGECSLVTRYENSTHVEFDKIVGGIDEVVEGETRTVLLVEGIMDKANTDRVLRLHKSPEIKCCFTFGCSLSDTQMLKLFKKGVQDIILLYDPGTTQQVKSISLRLQKYFNIFIGELVGDKDPGDMNLCEFEKVFLSLLNPIDYYTNRVQNIILHGTGKK